MCKKHGQISSLRFLFDQTRCEVCMKEFYTFSKMHNHLRHSRQCREGLQQRQVRCIPTEGHGSLTDQALMKRHDGLLPPMPSYGPSSLPPAQRQVLDFDVELYGELTEVLMGSGTMHSKVAEIRVIATQRPVSWTSFLHTLQCFQDNVQPDDLQAFSLSQSDLQAVFSDLSNPDTWECFRTREWKPRMCLP